MNTYEIIDVNGSRWFAEAEDEESLIDLYDRNASIKVKVRENSKEWSWKLFAGNIVSYRKDD